MMGVWNGSYWLTDLWMELWDGSLEVGLGDGSYYATGLWMAYWMVRRSLWCWSSLVARYGRMCRLEMWVGVSI